MHQYRRQNPSLRIIDKPKSTHPVPCPGRQAPPTRFQVKQSAYKSKSSLQDSTVDAEYQKYKLGALSSDKSDILKFWEVRLMLLDGTTTHPLIGQQSRLPDTVCNRHGLSPSPGHIRAL